MIQVGIIAIDGRQIGVVTQAEGAEDNSMPISPGGEAPMAMPSELPLGGAYGGDHRYSPHPHGGHQHHSGGSGHAGGHGGGGSGSGEIGSVPYSSSGNPFDRSRFAKELEQKPWLREKIHQLAAGEDRPSSGDSLRANMAVMETMMNRAVVRGTSLEEQAKWYGREKGGYYAGKPSHLSDTEHANSEANLNRVLAGSNITNYATDNSSGGLAAREKDSGRFKHHATINGESFFSPGSGEPAFRNRWQQLNDQAQGFEKNQTAKNPTPPEASGASPAGSGKAGDALNWMKQREGLQENRNRGELKSDMGGFDPAVEAWCAAFVNSALKNAGIQGSGSAVANSFQRWGNRVGPDDIKAGDVAVMSRGRGADQTGGHVGMATGATRVDPNGQRQFEMEAGNDANRVRRTWHNLDDPTIHFRRAPSDGGEKVAAKPFDPETMAP